MRSNSTTKQLSKIVDQLTELTKRGAVEWTSAPSGHGYIFKGDGYSIVVTGGYHASLGVKDDANHTVATRQSDTLSSIDELYRAAKFKVLGGKELYEVILKDLKGMQKGTTGNFKWPKNELIKDNDVSSSYQLPEDSKHYYE